MATQRLLSAQAVNAIMKQRIPVPTAKVGKKIAFTIQGDGTQVMAKDKDGAVIESSIEPGTPLEKKIYNLQANSAMAMKNPRNIEYLRAARTAEKAGDLEEAHTQYNLWLNAVQISFGILLPSKIADRLTHGVDISARVELITTENGSLLTIDPKSISILEPEYLGKTTFDMDAILGIVPEEADKELV